MKNGSRLQTREHECKTGSGFSKLKKQTKNNSAQMINIRPTNTGGEGR